MIVFDNGTSRLMQGDCRDVLAALPEQSVHMVVTSPPYWGLRSYQAAAPTVWGGEPGHEHEWQSRRRLFEVGSGNWTQAANGTELATGRHQTRFKGDTSAARANTEYQEAEEGTCPCGAWRGVLGSEPTPERYVENIVAVFRAVKRVLRDDGTLWLNLGPTWAGSGGAGGDYADEGLREGQPKYRAARIGWPAKCMVPIPWMVGLALIQDGWILRSEIIWDKPAPMPESVTDRPTKSHEQILLLTKSNTATYWTHRNHAGTREAPEPDYRWQLGGHERDDAPDGWTPKVAGCGCCGGDRSRHWQRVNLWTGRDYYYDAEAIKESTFGSDTHSRGTKLSPPKEANGVKQSVGHEGWTESTPDPVPFRNARSVWRIAPEPSPEKHYAMYPSGLPRRCILAGTSERGCCPECGAQWERQVSKERSFESGSGRAGNLPIGKNGAHMQGGGETPDVRSGPTVHTQTLGWAAACAHGLDPVPSTVLDPFAGTATTLAVAQELGRRSIGIELSPDYAAMAARRLGKVPLPLPAF